METKIHPTNKKLKEMDKPGFHRSKGDQQGLSEPEKKESKRPKNETAKTGTKKKI